MKEFTFRAMFLGLILTVILGAANAYLGLRAGITIAATYPAAVIAMAVLRAWKGSLLEENIARTAGSIGESVAAGAIFTLPAFVLAGAWPFLVVRFVLEIDRLDHGRENPRRPLYFAGAASHGGGPRASLPGVGGRFGDSQGRATWRKAAKYLFWNIGVGGLVYILGSFGLFAAGKDFLFAVGNLGRSQVRLGLAGSKNIVATGAMSTFAAPSVSPAYLGVGYIIGLRLASIQFAGGVLAWGLMVPLLIYFLGPQIKQYLPADTPDDWAAMAIAVWNFIVRPIAVGGMLVGAAYTLFKMGKSLTAGWAKRSAICADGGPARATCRAPSNT